MAFFHFLLHFCLQIKCMPRNLKKWEGGDKFCTWKLQLGNYGIVLPVRGPRWSAWACRPRTSSRCRRWLRGNEKRVENVQSPVLDIHLKKMFSRFLLTPFFYKHKLVKLLILLKSRETTLTHLWPSSWMRRPSPRPPRRRVRPWGPPRPRRTGPGAGSTCPGCRRPARGPRSRGPCCNLIAMKFFIVFRVKLRKWPARGKVFLIASRFNESFIVFCTKVGGIYEREIFLFFLSMSKRKQNIHILSKIYIFFIF